jgi:hypothetical protein
MLERVRSRTGGLTLAVVLVVAVVALTLVLCGRSSAGVLARAKTARTETLTMTAHLHYVRAKGSHLLEEGFASGSLAGPVKAQVRITANISGDFTFHPRGGSISGQGVATLHESGTYVSFGGTVKVTGGTGRYAHASGGGGLYGVYKRNTSKLELTIQTTGTVVYPG